MNESFDRFIIDVPRDEISSLMEAIRFDINGFGYFLQQDDGRVPSFSVRDYEWILYTQGHVKLTCGSLCYDVEPGDMLLLEPNRTYSADCDGPEPVHYYYIHFMVRPDYLLDSYMAGIFGNSPQRLLRAGTIPDFAPHFNLLLKDRLHGEAGTQVLIHELLASMSVFMMRRLWNLQASRNPSDTLTIPRGEDIRLCSQAVSIMRTHLGDGLRVEDICVQMGVSTSFLYKLFVRVFHQSPSQYMMEERLKYVCHLLLDEGCTVAQAAEKLGFSSASHMSMQFKRIYGQTPSQWLKNRREKKA